MRRSHAPSSSFKPPGAFKPPLARAPGVPSVGAAPVAVGGGGAGAAVPVRTLQKDDDDVEVEGKAAVVRSHVPTGAAAAYAAVTAASAALAPVTNTLGSTTAPSQTTKRARPGAKFGAPMARAVAAPSTAETVVARYFKCMYRKSSRKVHKAWEGDGFLECRGGFVTIKDEEGKDVSKVSDAKTARS
jgi:hypothetical protein